MSTLTISHSFQIGLPKEIREALQLRPGQKLQALVYDGRIELLPFRPAREMRGFLRGIDTSIRRSRD